MLKAGPNPHVSVIPPMVNPPRAVAPQLSCSTLIIRPLNSSGLDVWTSVTAIVLNSPCEAPIKPMHMLASTKPVNLESVKMHTA